jgi:hypothetical protein
MLIVRVGIYSFRFRDPLAKFHRQPVPLPIQRVSKERLALFVRAPIRVRLPRAVGGITPAAAQRVSMGGHLLVSLPSELPKQLQIAKDG